MTNSDRSSEGYTGEGYTRAPPDPFKFDFQTAELLVERLRSAFDLPRSVRTVDEAIEAIRVSRQVEVRPEPRKSEREELALNAARHAADCLHQALVNPDAGFGDHETFRSNHLEPAAVLINYAQAQGWGSYIGADLRQKMGLPLMYSRANVRQRCRELLSHLEPKLWPQGIHWTVCDTCGEDIRVGEWHCGFGPLEASVPIEERDEAEAPPPPGGVVSKRPADPTPRAKGPQGPQAPARQQNAAQELLFTALADLERRVQVVRQYAIEALQLEE